MRKESNVQNCRDNELLVRGWGNKFNKVEMVVCVCVSVLEVTVQSKKNDDTFLE